jgi:guanylate kinase
MPPLRFFIFISPPTYTTFIYRYTSTKTRFLTTMAPTTTTPRRLIVLSGPSGVGKSTLIQRLEQKHPDAFGFSVSHTTRQPRGSEEDGREYHFVTVKKMEDMIADDQFLEYARFGDNYYGTSRKAVKDVEDGRGRTFGGLPAPGDRVCILDIEMEGVKQLKKSGLNPRICFIQPPSIEELERRLRKRETDKEDAILKRLAQAKKEMEYCKTEGKNDRKVTNDKLDLAFEELDEWVMEEL